MTIADRQRRRWMLGLTTVALLAFGVTLLDLVTTGANLQFGVIRLSTRDALRPFVIAVVCGAAAIWQVDRGQSRRSWYGISDWSDLLALIASLLTVGAAIHFGIFVAGGADAYGYVSEASLWATGHLVVPERLASLQPSLGSSAAPLGFRLATTPGAIVPIYPAGLPLMMAIALKFAGPSGVYYVVPLLSGLTVWLTYLIGTRVDGRRTGLLAAVLMACSPTFLLQSFEPMSDVPATAFWLLAIALAISPRERSEGYALCAGLAVSVAVLTRPNLAPLLLIVGLMVMTSPRPVRRGLLFAIGVIPGFVAMALIGRSLYGSALGSGYGSVDAFFSLSHVVANLRTYPVWLLQLHSIFVLLALASPFVSIDAIDRVTSPADAVTRRWLMLCFGGLLFLCYVFYVPYDTWPFLRFLLPGIPLLLVLSSTVPVAFIHRMPDAIRGAALLALCGLLGAKYIVKAKALNIFLTKDSEHRYVAVGEYVDRELPNNAVVLTVIQSGRIRLYGHRATVRWDQLSPGGLDAAISALESNGYVPYVLLEGWEQSAFVERFGNASDVARLRWPPAFEFDGFERVQIFSPQDRRLSLAGQTIRTKRIPL